MEFDHVDELSQLALQFSFYNLLSSINTLIVFLRITQFYKFSKKLSLLTVVLADATMDVGFFVLMFLIVKIYFNFHDN